MNDLYQTMSNTVNCAVDKYSRTLNISIKSDDINLSFSLSYDGQTEQLLLIADIILGFTTYHDIVTVSDYFSKLSCYNDTVSFTNHTIQFKCSIHILHHFAVQITRSLDKPYIITTFTHSPFLSISFFISLSFIYYFFLYFIS